MSDIDVFNGDADGICALIQLRQQEPRDAQLITGIKRDIRLLEQVKAGSGDRVTVLDISMKQNTQSLQRLLQDGASVFYADHHQAGDIPHSPLLEAHIYTQSNTCTGLIADYLLQGRYREWAIVAAYGDNIVQVADDYAARLSLSERQRGQLRNLGIAMNYNGYGFSAADLFYHPARLYRLARPYTSPFDFIADQALVYQTLTQGYQDDLDCGLKMSPELADEQVALFVLPDCQWARRISGVLGNELANRYPQRAHAVLTPMPAVAEGGSYFQVSLRAPKNNLTGADQIASEFGGGGRQGAAGINNLPAADIQILFRCLQAEYSVKSGG